jgi:L-lactate utilization protein LutC
MDRATQGGEIRQLSSAPAFMLGSVRAVTKDGSLMIASMTGSQHAPESYGAEKVIFVVGHQKIVADMSRGLQGIFEYSFRLEDARARKMYGSGSGVNKDLDHQT